MFDWLTIFDWVESEELNTISELVQERFVKKWEFLFKQGEDAIAMYIIKDWNMNLIKDGSYLLTMKTDSIFWEKAFFKWFTKRLMSARAKEDSILIVMLYENFKLFLKKHPDYKSRMKEYFSTYNIDSKLP